LKPPDYRDRLSTGIVHFGPGAFHRAHQADYVDRLLHDDPRWGIAAVSLRSAATVDALKAQDGLYTLAVLDARTSFRTIGAHSRFFGPNDGACVRQQLRDPAVRIVTSTVTEKGYCLAGDGTLDFTHPDISRDLLQPEQPVSLIGWLAMGLADRRANALPPFTPLCCDNMAANGRKLQAAVLAFAQRIDPQIARWIEGEVAFPNTMVDSITPATDDRLRSLVRDGTGFDDAVPVSREAYTQWVLEDGLPPGSPDFRSVGVTLTPDVEAWEKAKLRILNGAHSSLAYLGLLLGLETVAEAMAHVEHRHVRAQEAAHVEDRAQRHFGGAEGHHRRRMAVHDGERIGPLRVDLAVYEALEIRLARVAVLHVRLQVVGLDVCARDELRRE